MQYRLWVISMMELVNQVSNTCQSLIYFFHLFEQINSVAFHLILKYRDVHHFIDKMD